MDSDSLPSAGTPSLQELNERHRLVYDSLAEQYDARADALHEVTASSIDRFLSFGVPVGGRVLDVGCGAGVTTRVLTDRGRIVTATDLSGAMVEVTARRVPEAVTLVGDYASLPLPVGGFEGVVAFAYIHLFPRGEAVAQMRKMHGELAPGGLLLIGTTEERVSSEGLEGKGDYVGAPRRFRRRWSRDDFLGALDEAGFDLVDLMIHGDPFGKHWMDAIVRRVETGA